MWEVLGEYQGPPYFKPFVRYVMARLSKKADERSFMVYVTDSLRLAPQMMYLSSRWVDIVGSGTRRDERSADEIVDDFLARFEE